jgi:hypothetical protein
MLQWYVLCACGILHILVALNLYQQAFFGAIAGEAIGVKILIMILMSANLVHH